MYRLPATPLTHRIAAALLAAALVGSSACSSDSTQPPPQAPVTPVDAATAGRIQVEVAYTGTVPAPKALNMSATPMCAAAHPEPVSDDALLVRDGHLSNAVVWIKSGLGDRAFPVPNEAIKIDQRGCLYHPRVAAVMVGQAVEFVNSDPEPHNVHGRPETIKPWNFMMSRQNASRTLYFDKPEVGIRVGCDIHPWMVAYMTVLPHPYFAVTAADGSVTLPNVPPGDYVVAVWHEKLGLKEQAVSLAPSATAKVQFAYAG